MDKAQKKALTEEWKNRRPEMGVISLRCRETGEVFLGTAKDTKAAFNSVRAKLSGGLHPNKRLMELWKQYGVSIGVVTCNYGRDDLDQYAMKRAEEMGLGGYDMIVALDISGDNYWLIQGSDISGAFTDQDCSDYAYEYMEYDFARGFYGDGLLSLTEALESWYEDYFD